MNIDDVVLKRNVQIYTVSKKLKKVSRAAIVDGALKKISKEPLIAASGKGTIQLPLAAGQPAIDVDYDYSVHVFTTRKKVDFLDIDAWDEVHGHLTIIEIGNYVGILRKNCANIEILLEKHLKLVPHEKILSLAATADTEFQKLALRNMTTSEKAIRGRQYEATNLDGLLSLHSAGRSIPHTMRIRQGGSVKSLTASTGRIIEQSERQAVHDIAQWLLLITSQISNNNIVNEFLASFAKPKNLSEVLKTCKPAAILIETGQLHDDIEAGEINLGREKGGTFIKLSKKTTQKLLLELENCYEIDGLDKIQHPYIQGKIKKNAKSLTFDIPTLKKIKTHDTVTVASLQQHLIRNKLYSICFSDPKYMYFKGECFEDTSGISEIDSIIKVLHKKPELKNATSEKGDMLPSSTCFEASSVFSMTEKIHQNDDYIFCDDLGDEWADHITMNMQSGTIRFIHSKHGKTSNSASKFHDVVGQGIKNIGNMTFNNEQFQKKIKSTFIKNYNGQKIQTKISRIRRGNAALLSTELPSLLEKPGLIRECILCCSFASKDQIENEFTKIKNKKKVSGNIIQLLWILSSFIHATKEANIVPIIYCQ